MSITTAPQVSVRQQRGAGRWCRLAVIALCHCLAACASDDSDDDNDDSNDDAATGGPVCRTVELTNTVASEKTNAAICLGMAYQDAYSCSFDSVDNATYCVGSNSTGYWVQWVGGAYGDAYDGFDGTLMASIGQGSTGAYVIDWADGDHGECSVTGDVARLCMY